ncbi:quinohemoprotein amine dehydrogenase subunit alpha [Maliponia aquimaris]|uniref:Quinohemoprotein amine dehydrogenase A, alpha subunit, heme binding n=1 Tax=Maliponia aquimaris TaxID=1673631 RepID=A0A238K7I8_9RHOB|nr:quinohemoprotein amine dehydrogenase subunit alpha [Maliponia aquimaris]SMX38763.1 Quinohemoprotein amine dehydrogenase A, alpha subunit, heme binding [Maliponia aquimaris]
MTRSKTAPALIAALALAGTPALAQDGAQLLADACGSCHEATEAGLSRIAGQRKTPEGWLMTIVRMRLVHDVVVSPDDQAALVAYLSETQGLAPSEAAPWRYALEKDPAHVEVVEEPMASMCARCHTAARVGLQRRTTEEWDLHMDFHVGQFPTVEYQALGRDREWYKIAKTEMVPLLSDAYPLETEEWTAWQAAEKQAPGGDWVVLTDLPGKGRAFGRITVAGDASPFALSGTLWLEDGSEMPVAGQMNLYTGYEWRANLSIDGEAFRQVVALSEDGDTFEGRQFLRDRDSLGGTISGARDGAGPAILGTVPEALMARSGDVLIVGTGLEGIGAEGGELVVHGATPVGLATSLLTETDGAVALTAGDARSEIVVSEAFDRITVEPSFAIARVGGDSPVGPDAVPIAFKAIGWANGPDGQPGTEDDLRLGVVPTEWSVTDHNEVAAAMRDAEFAGSLGEDGIFMPAAAGPNPARPFSTNNAGDLKIVANSGGLSAEAQLIVTVQRFIDPPIR